MKSVLNGTLTALTLAAFAFAQNEPAAKTSSADAADKPLTSVLDAVVKDIDGKEVPLRGFEGEVLLIVNVATRCGLTAQNYAEFEPLHQKYKDRGFRILAFPCNDFGGQEPGTSEEIKSFCRSTHHGTYELFDKVSVKGEAACPLYKYLTTHPDEKIRGDVRWNFQKYLVARDGTVLEKFDPRTAPNDAKLGEAIEKALTAPRPEKKKEPASKSG
ncbi:MAG: hypothetical protein FLDDKLPJ_00677 [Phycisphaerae bacterium]|nr:hypothetical protein [Phycisphaerae bacterium]